MNPVVYSPCILSGVKFYLYCGMCGNCGSSYVFNTAVCETCVVSLQTWFSVGVLRTVL